MTFRNRFLEASATILDALKKMDFLDNNPYFIFYFISKTARFFSLKV